MKPLNGLHKIFLLGSTAKVKWYCGLLWSVLVLYGARLLAESVPMKITKAKEKFLLVNTLVSKKLVVLK